MAKKVILILAVGAFATIALLASTKADYVASNGKVLKTDWNGNVFDKVSICDIIKL